jgi:hypothetical protein
MAPPSQAELFTKALIERPNVTALAESLARHAGTQLAH